MGRKTTGAKLEREAVKRYLQQYHAAKQKKRILEERRRTLSAELRGPSTAPAFRATPSTAPAFRATPSAKLVHPDGAGALRLFFTWGSAAEPLWAESGRRSGLL